VRAFVTGGAGFIGSHLVDRLLAGGHEVTVYDNLSTGRRRFLEGASAHAGFRLVEGDIQDASALSRAVAGHDQVFHLAANADVRHGTAHPRRDLEQNTIATWNVLEGMRAHGVRRIAFTSTGSVYGEPDVFPTPESCPFPEQTSLYGASKAAAEGLLSAYCHGFGFEARVFRLVSALGERYQHGHVLDFMRKLRANPEEIEVLGDGRQRKSYLYVLDVVDAMLLGVARATGPFVALNIGHDQYCMVDESLGWITERLGLAPRRRYTGGTRGWVGDSPFILLDASRIRALGWSPTLSVRDAVLRTVDDITANPWLMTTTTTTTDAAG
jgi:UDP-glucose 4-epimerase